MSEMTEIIIGYEDRLRLSELAGQMAKAQWTVDNAVTVAIPFTITIVAFTLFAIPLLFSDYFDGSILTSREKRNRRIIIVTFIIIVAVELILIPYICMMFAERDLVVIQTEIDEIYRIWGMSG